MVLFHFCYDLKLFDVCPMDWFAFPIRDLWRHSISWTFVFVAGCMYAYSKNNLKRAARYLLVSALISLVTVIAAVDVPIFYGVIYCMGSCTLICWLLDRVGFRPYGLLPAIVLFIVFLAIFDVPRGTFGLCSLGPAVPRQLYDCGFLTWLGFPAPGFRSSDYYPTLPFLLLYLAGSARGRQWRQEGLPAWLDALRCDPLEWVGRHALSIYLLHQPVCLAVVTLLAR